MRGSSHCRTALTSSSHDASQDTNNNRVRRVDIATGVTTTLAGSGTRGFLNGASGSAKFYQPFDVEIDQSGTFALVTVRPPLYHPHLAIPQTAHPPRTRRIGRTGSHHTLRGQASGLPLPQGVLP